VEQTVALTATEYRLEGLEAFRARAGERVAFSMTNAGTEPHALRITDPDGAVVGELPPVPPGSAATLAVTLPRNGTYTLVCPIADHAARGMQLTLVVGR
jgi:plastocyanin